MTWQVNFITKALFMTILMVFSGCTTDRAENKKAGIDKAFETSDGQDEIATPQHISKPKASSNKDDDTGGDSGVTGGGGSTASEIVRTDNVVQQIGNKSLVLSRVGAKEWLQISASQEAGDRRIWASLAVGEWDIASNIAKESLAQRSADPQVLVVLVASLIYGKKYELARYYLDVLEALHPKRPEIPNFRGLLQVMIPNARIADLKKAEAFFKLAFQRDPDPIAAGLNLGYLYLDTGNAKDANVAFRTLMDRSFDFIPVMMGYGISFCRLGQYDKAKGIFEAVLKKKPNHGQASYYLGLVYWKGYKKVDKAKEYLQKAVAEVRDPVMQEKTQALMGRMQ